MRQIPSKTDIQDKLHSIIRAHKGDVWGTETRDRIRDKIMEYFNELGISARKFEIMCDDEGYVSVIANDFYYVRDTN